MNVNLDLTKMFQILEEAKTVAIIGLSSNEYRTSNHIGSYLQEQGYRIIPVNPNEGEFVLGEKVYASLSEIPSDIKIDIIDIFRNNQFTEATMREIADWSKEVGYKPLIWTQLDVSSPGAEKIAEVEGFEYVRNRCIMVEHSRL